MEKIKIGIGHLIKGMQLAGFGHEEIMTMKQFLMDNKGKSLGVTKNIGFVDDYYSKDWEDNSYIIEEIVN